MSLRLPRNPATARAALIAGLGKFGVEAGEYQTIGLPLYDISLADLLADKGPIARGAVAWRYLLLVGQPGQETAARIADVVRRAGCSRRYVLGTTPTVGAENLLAGLTAAAGRGVTTRGRLYTIRLARFPALNGLAVWLDGPRFVDDVFLPLHPGLMGLAPLKPVTRRYIYDRLQAPARRKIAASHHP